MATCTKGQVSNSFGKCYVLGLSCTELSAWNHFLDYSWKLQTTKKAVYPEQSNVCA